MAPTSAKFSFGCHYLQVILAFRERAKHADTFEKSPKTKRGKNEK